MTETAIVHPKQVRMIYYKTNSCKLYVLATMRLNQLSSFLASRKPMLIKQQKR